MLSRPAALLLILATLALMAVGLVAAPGPGGRFAPTGSSRTDAALYDRIVSQVAAGTPYYQAAMTAQRARGYPVRPFVTVRPPTLAVTTAAIGRPATVVLFLTLAIGAAVAFAIALWPASAKRAEWIAASTLAALGAALAGQPPLILWHDIWAGLLLMLAVASWRPHCVWPALAAALAAVAFRELALPVLFAMAVMALAERRLKEAGAWGAAILVAAIGLALHASAVAALVLPGDPVSPGWFGTGGWPLLLTMFQQTSLFGLLPAPATALLVPLAFAGWVARADALGRRVTLLLLGYGAMLMLFARPDNFYWSVLVAPILPVGLAFLPRIASAIAGPRKGG